VPVAAVPAVTAPVPAVAITVPAEVLGALAWIWRSAPRPVARVGMFRVTGWVWLPVVGDGVAVGITGVDVIGDKVPVEVAATGVGITGGVTAGVAESGEVVNEKAPLLADELLEGSAAGVTVRVWVEELHRPWHMGDGEPKDELPVTAGRPCRLGVVGLESVRLVLSDPGVGVVVVPVVVVLVPVVVVVVDGVVVEEVVVVPVVVGLVVV
jgi:hypothetical protein